MTDPLLTTLARLGEPDDVLDVTADPGGLATRALARARRRTRARRAAVAAAVPLAAAAAVLVASVGPAGLLAGLRGSGPAAAPSPTFSSDRWSGVDRVNVLLVGTDTVPGRTHWNADSIVLATIDTRTGDTLLVGVPRNRVGAVGPTGSFAMEQDPTVATIVPRVEQLTGLHVDTTVRMDMSAFETFVDVLGGVEVTVRQKLPVGGSYTDSGAVRTRPTEFILPGRQKLDGRHALWFARSRFSTDDYDRMRRQRCLLGAVAAQAEGPRLLRLVPRLLETAQGHVETTIALSDLPAWVELAGKVRSGHVRGLTLDLPLQAGGAPDVDGSRAAVAAALATSGAAASGAAGSGAAGSGAAGSGATPSAAAGSPGATPVAGTGRTGHGVVEDLSSAC